MFSSAAGPYTLSISDPNGTIGLPVRLAHLDVDNVTPTVACGSAPVPANVPHFMTVGISTTPGLSQSPIVLVHAGSCVCPGLTLGPDAMLSLDLGTLGFVFDGTGSVIPPNFLTPLSVTDTTGAFRFGINVVRPAGPWVALQGTVINPAYPIGLALTEAIRFVAQ